MNNKEWRPSDWEQIKLHEIMKCINGADGGEVDPEYPFEAGASAMFKAVSKYLWESCSEHPIHCPDSRRHAYAAHRFNCPSCMRQLQESE